MVSELRYALNSKPKVNWTAGQEKSLANDYPFELEHESNDQYVVRTYLQFLWLPESIMSLVYLVPSLLRVVSESSSSEPHPLHALLKPLLQTARSASTKYHVELPRILSLGGGAGEIEETMMWYALNHEQADDDLWTRTSSIGEGPWEDEKWRLKWLERMERREFQIQILLYFLKLSLPGPPPSESSPQKRKKSREGVNNVASTLSVEDTLETFMDKMSMWQLVENLDNGSEPTNSKAEQCDWMQSFFNEIVYPQFGTKLPEMCSLFRSKIFPNSPFSSSSGHSSPSSSRATSPDIPRLPKHSIESNAAIRHPSPALSTTSSKKNRAPERSRSRSLSVSLAQERMRERERSVGTAVTKKRALNREVSMSRGFKPKTKALDEGDKAKIEAKKKLIASTKKETKIDEGVTLVAATPTKPKLLGRSQSQSVFGGGTGERQTQSLSFFPFGAAEEEEEEWGLSSSPDVLLLGTREVNNGSGASSDADEDAGAVRVLMRNTPTKRPRLR